MAIMMATRGHHDGNPLPSGWQPPWPGALPHGGTLAHRLTGPRAGWGAVSVGGFLFGTAWRSRNPRGETFFLQFLSAHVSIRNLRGEIFLKSFSPHMSWLERQFADVTSGNLRKMAHNGHEGGAWSASSHTLPAKTCAKWHLLPPWRGEKLETKLLSAHVSTRNLRREKLFKKLLATQVSASPGCAKKEPSHTHLASHHPPLHHIPFRLPHHTPPTTWARGHVGTPVRFSFVSTGGHPCWQPMAIMMATPGHHDGNPLPS